MKERLEGSLGLRSKWRLALRGAARIPRNEFQRAPQDEKKAWRGKGEDVVSRAETYVISKSELLDLNEGVASHTEIEAKGQFRVRKVEVFEAQKYMAGRGEQGPDHFGEM